jgi:hypothetical protein
MCSNTRGFSVRNRIPTLSDVQELVELRVENERHRAQTVAEWLDGRITRLESQVIIWGAIPTAAVAIAGIIAYFRK